MVINQNNPRSIYIVIIYVHLLTATVWVIVINFHACIWSLQQKILTVQIKWVEKKLHFNIATI